MVNKEGVKCNSVKAAWLLEELKRPAVLSRLLPQYGTIVYGEHPQVISMDGGFAFKTFGDVERTVYSNNDALKKTSSFEEQLVLLVASKCKLSGNQATIKFTKDKNQISCNCDGDSVSFSVLGSAGHCLECAGIQGDLVHEGATLSGFSSVVDTPDYKRLVSIERGQLVFILREMARFLNAYLVVGSPDEPDRRFSISEAGCSVHLLDGVSVRTKTLSLSNITLPENLVVYSVKGRQAFIEFVTPAKEGRKCT